MAAEDVSFRGKQLSGGVSYCVVSFLLVWRQSRWVQYRSDRHRVQQCCSWRHLLLSSGLVWWTWWGVRVRVRATVGGTCSTYTRGGCHFICLISFVVGLVGGGGYRPWSGVFLGVSCQCILLVGGAGKVCVLSWVTFTGGSFKLGLSTTLGFALCVVPATVPCGLVWPLFWGAVGVFFFFFFSYFPPFFYSWVRGCAVWFIAVRFIA